MAGASSVELLAGSVVNVASDIAEKWIKQGVAMMDKSLDGASENKDIVPNTVVPRKVTRKRKKVKL